MSTLTRHESRTLRATRREIDASGLASLITFANHQARPWTTLWSGIAAWRKISVRTKSIDGEPFSDTAADDLQGYVVSRLADLAHHRFSASMHPVRVYYTYLDDARGLEMDGPQDDLGEYFEWVIFEAIRTGQAKHVRQCRVCTKIFLGRSNRGTCSTACRVRSHRRDYQQKLRAQREARTRRNRAGL